MEFSSPFADVDIPENMSLTQYVFRNADQYPNDTAFVDEDAGKTLTYCEMRHAILTVAKALYNKGLDKGEVCCLYLPNSVEFALAFYALASYGAISSPANPAYSSNELHHQIHISNSKLLITTPDLLEKAKHACQGTAVREIIIVCRGRLDVLSQAAPISSSSFDSMLDDADVHSVTLPSLAGTSFKDHLLCIPFSSGTTGLPKGVMLTHFNLIANVCQNTSSSSLLAASKSDVTVGVLPFFHIYGMVVMLCGSLSCGAKIVCVSAFEPKKFLSLLHRHKVTFAPLVPPIILFLAKHPSVDEYDLSHLRDVVSGAAPLGKEVCELFTNRFKHCVLRQAYGMTEMSPVSHACPRHCVKVGSIGPILPNMKMRICDVHTGEILKAGQEGELCCKGPNIMKGYLNNPKATADMIDADGYLHTGDICLADEDGYVFIVDRLKELIKVKGFQVAPAELEAAILSHPHVADVAVIGIPHESAGELPKAFVVRKPDAQLSAEQVSQFVNNRLARHKHVHHVEFTDTIPKSAAGKILRRQLRSQHHLKSKL